MVFTGEEGMNLKSNQLQLPSDKYSGVKSAVFASEMQ